MLHYTYLGLLVMCFLLAMGNTPKGSKKMYTFAMVAFAIIQVYITVRLSPLCNGHIMAAALRVNLANMLTLLPVCGSIYCYQGYNKCERRHRSERR